MKSLVLSDVAAREILKALRASSELWQKGMPEGHTPFSDDVERNIYKQIMNQEGII